MRRLIAIGVEQPHCDLHIEQARRHSETAREKGPQLGLDVETNLLNAK